MISPDRRCFRPDADVGNVNCASTACSSPSFDGQIGTGIHEGGLAWACVCVCCCAVSRANGQISSSSRQGDVGEDVVLLVGEGESGASVELSRAREMALLRCLRACEARAGGIKGEKDITASWGVCGEPR